MGSGSSAHADSDRRASRRSRQVFGAAAPEGGVEKGKVTREAMDATLANLKGTSDLKDLRDATS